MTTDEFVQAVEAADPEALAVGITVLGIGLAVWVIGAIIWYFVSALGYLKMFRKAGESGWKAFIPIYNDYIRYKISWSGKYFWLAIATALVAGIAEGFGVLVLDIVALVVLIINLVIIISVNIRLAKSFGKGAFCGVLLFLFPFIVSLVLGFGKSQYIRGAEHAESVV